METNHETKKNTLQESILQKIRMDEIKMRPRTFFAFKFAALVLVTVATLVTSAFLFSFILFSVRASGRAAEIGFGPHPIDVFIALFPWTLLLVDIILIAFLGWLFHAFRFGYKSPVLYLLCSAALFMIVLGVVIDQGTPLHAILLRKADRNELPFFGGMYQDLHRPPPLGHGVYRGTIVQVSGLSLTVAIDNPMGFGSTTLLTFTLPATSTIGTAQVGDHILIGGQEVGKEIEASQIKDAGDTPESQVQ